MYLPREIITDFVERRDGVRTLRRFYFDRKPL
jgi:hypothetical protein